MPLSCKLHKVDAKVESISLNDSIYLKDGAKIESGYIICEYKRGMKDGLAVLKEDSLLKVGFFKNDKQIGIWHSYDKNGKLIKISEYTDGFLFKYYTIENGRISKTTVLSPNF